MNSLSPIRWPMVIVLLSILFGTGMGIVFGVWEDVLKAKIADQLQFNQKLQSLAPEQQEKEKENLKSRAWQYVKRAHLHGGGISALSLGLLLLLARLKLNKKIKFYLGSLLAFGGFLYPFFWLGAAYFTPALGATAAKEKVEFLAGGGLLHVAATFAIFIILIVKGFTSEETERGSI